jgi:hypothetical protein
VSHKIKKPKKEGQGPAWDVKATEDDDETWSLILRHEYKLRLLENRVLRRNLDIRGMKTA